MSGAPSRRAGRKMALAAAFIAVPFCGALAARFSDWATVESERFGYSMAYPGSVFLPEPELSSDDVRVFYSRDRRAKLLVGAFPNTEETSLGEYRAFLLENNYLGGELDYAPVHGKWFVVSGARDGTMFYERVSFTCGGHLINSWAMLYPVAERRFYDRVVEAVARAYTPGAGRDGSCDLGSS